MKLKRHEKERLLVQPTGNVNPARTHEGEMDAWCAGATAGSEPPAASGQGEGCTNGSEVSLSVRPGSGCRSTGQAPARPAQDPAVRTDFTFFPNRAITTTA